MITVKHVCKKCGYATTMTNKEKIILQIKSFFLGIFVIFGVILTLFIITVGPLNTIDILGSEIILSASKYNADELRMIGVNASRDCLEYGYNTDSWCYGVAVFKKYSNIDYVPANTHKPMQSIEMTLKYGGDCKNSNLIFVQTMRSLGFKANLDCDVYDQHHCIAILPHYNNLKYLNEYAVIDLTIPEFYKMNNSQDAWNYRENGIAYGNYI